MRGNSVRMVTTMFLIFNLSRRETRILKHALASFSEQKFEAIWFRRSLGFYRELVLTTNSHHISIETSGNLKACWHTSLDGEIWT